MKVMVVDDELPIREWIRMMIQKVEREIEIVACVSSGEEAYKSFVTYNPDLIISDIKMGNMDGIELLEKIKSIKKDIYFVLLTSHNDFDYARKALKYGANEYILKTEVTIESIEKIIDNYVSGMEKVEKKKIYIEEVYEWEENTYKTYFAICYRNEFDKAFNEFGSLEKVRLLGSYYDRSENCYQLVEGGDGVSNVSQYNEVLIAAKNISSIYSIPVGMSGMSSTPKEAFERAREAYELNFYQDDIGVNVYAKHDNFTVKEELMKTQQECIKAIYNDNYYKVKMCFEDMVQLTKQKKYSNVKEVKNMVVDILYAYKLSLLSLGSIEVQKEIEDKKNQVREATKLSVVYSVVLQLFTATEEGSMNNTTYSIYTKKAIAFVQKNYSDNISLVDVVDELKINTEYFCRVFKKETGKTFLTYLTEYKVKKAQELLAKTDYSIQEISDRLGYSSVAYFSKVFKSKTGKNPLQYRKE